MKYQLLKYACLLVAMVGLVTSTDAQRRGRTTRANQPATNQPTTPQPQQQTNNTAPTNYNPYAGVPIIVAPSAGGFNDSLKKSLRMDGAT